MVAFRFRLKAKIGKLISKDLIGNELLNDRAEVARRRLPGGIKILEGDAAEIDLAEEPLDIVYHSAGFNSILGDGF